MMVYTTQLLRHRISDFHSLGASSVTTEKDEKQQVEQTVEDGEKLSEGELDKVAGGDDPYYDPIPIQTWQ